MQFVHLQCLILWIVTKKSTTCDICNTSLIQYLEQVSVSHLELLEKERRAPEKLPYTLQCALVMMWIYTTIILLLPFIARHLEAPPI